ncbi:ArsR/SmtB family transcription factor [Elstera litoralis]|uniref:ArsR/SmtB family transcription factor n=1 Tax=Elstera litoralis TaxID=552518 RepID=UPI002FC2C9AF
MDVLTPPVPGLATLEAKAEEVSRVLTAMANPKRLLVLCNLLEGEQSVGALAEAVGLAQAALSQHLSKMRRLGWSKPAAMGKPSITGWPVPKCACCWKPSIGSIVLRIDARFSVGLHGSCA